MEDTSAQTIIETLLRQREFFASGQTKDPNFRLIQLKHFKEAVIRFEKRKSASWFRKSATISGT
jgi:hypothetical protein